MALVVGAHPQNLSLSLLSLRPDKVEALQKAGLEFFVHDVLARIDDYRSAGIEVLIVSGMPLLEEAYRFAVLVLPHLPVERAADGGITSAWTKERDAAWKSVA
jgi:hypothetical protein